MAQAQCGNDGLCWGQARQRGQLVAHIELHHIVKRRRGRGNDLVHLQTAAVTVLGAFGQGSLESSSSISHSCASFYGLMQLWHHIKLQHERACPNNTVQ